MAVFNKGRREHEPRRNRIAPLETPFAKTPTTVCALGYNIHPFDQVLTHLAEIKRPRAGVEAKTPGIAHSDCPELRSHTGNINWAAIERGHTEVRIVGWDAVIC